MTRSAFCLERRAAAHRAALRIRTRQSQHLWPYLAQWPLLSVREGISSIAIGAAEIASSQPHENARQPGESALALQTQVDFVDDQCVRHGPTLVAQSIEEKPQRYFDAGCEWSADAAGLDTLRKIALGSRMN